MDPNDVESILIKTQDSDPKIIKEVTKFLTELNKTDKCIPVYFELLNQSIETIAKNAASTMLYQFIKSNIGNLTPETTEFLKIQLVVYLDQNPRASKTIWNSLSDSIILIVQHTQQFWPELDQFIYKLANDFSPHRLNTLSKVISFLPNDLILAKYQIYGSFATAAITNSTDFEIISTGILILSSLIDASGSSAEFEICFAKIIEIITAVLPAQALPSQIEKQFWNSMTLLISDLVPSELISAILQYLTIPDLDSQKSIVIFESLRTVMQCFSFEQVMGILTQAIVLSIKHFELYQELPADILSIFDSAFKYFPHAQLYEFTKAKISELSQVNIVITILLLSPLVSYAYDKLIDEINIVIEPLKFGFQSNTLIIIEACQDVIENMSEHNQLIGSWQESLFPLIAPLLVSEDSEIRNSCYESLLSLFDSSCHKSISIHYLTSLLTIKTSINECNYEQYLKLIGEIIANSENISDAQVHEILEMLVPLLDISHNPNFSGVALYVLGQLICNGEFSEIETIIPNTFDASKFNLKSKNDSDTVYALIYLLQLANTYGESVAEMLHKLWPLISKMISKNPHVLVMEYLLKLSCEIAILSHDAAIVPQILPVLNSQFQQEDHEEVFIAVSSRIVRLLDKNQYQALLVLLIHICLECEDCDTVASGFMAIYKYLKYSIEETREDTIQKVNQIIDMFFKGTLNCLEMRSILDPQVDINLELLTSFGTMVNKFVSYPSPFVEPVCQMFLALGSRDSTEYKNVVIQVFIDAIENGTIQPSVSMELLHGFETFMATNDEGLQQNIVYLLIIILKNYPDFIQSVSKYLPLITQWWSAYLPNQNRYGEVLSNIASFFLLLASITMMQNFPLQLLEQTMIMFPPTDLTETLSMCQCLLKLFGGLQNNPELDAALTPAFRVKTAIGIAKLLSEPAKKKRKMNLNQEIIGNITMVFRTLCQAQEILQSVIESLQNNEKRKAIILEILQS